MLRQAILYKDELRTKYIGAMCDDHFKFYNCTTYSSFDFEVKESDCWKIQMVSVDDNDNVIGYMTNAIDRDSKIMNCFGIMNFTKKTSLTFSRDLLSYIKYLRDTCQASKFEFCAYVGGKPEVMYSKFIDKHGGRIVGTYTDGAKLQDGKYYDCRMFEIMRKDMNF